MRKLLLVVLVAILPFFAFAQVTPNLGLSITAPGTLNSWGSVVNGNMSILDTLNPPGKASNNTFTAPNTFNNAGVFTSAQMNLYVQSVIGGCNSAAEHFAVQGTNATEALTGCAQFAAGSTVFGGYAVAGYLNNASMTTQTAAMYAQARVTGNGTVNTEAFNCLVTDAAGITGTGDMACEELDVNIFGSPKTAHGLILTGIAGSSGVMPANAGGIVVTQLGGTSPLAWPCAFCSARHAGVTGINLDGASNSNPTSSQAVQFFGYDSGGTYHASKLFGDNLGDLVLTPATGSSVRLTGPPTSTGTAAVLSGTGACVRITTQKGGSWAGQLTCTGTTGASTIVITPGTTAPNGWSCFASDLTTANTLRQSAVAATSCTIAGTVNASDVLTFGAIAY